MTIPQMYMYDLKTGEYTGSRDATLRPNGEPILEATGATPVALPASIPSGHVARWTGDAWETVEDHRQHMDERGRKEGGTPYWLPGDTWRSEPRYMEELGPLPTDALLERPRRPLEEYKVDKRREIIAGYTAALTATLTMPAESPSVAEAVGLVDVQTILIARRDELLAAVEAAQRRETVSTIVVSYPV